jgi:hypothetical protein
MRDGVPVAVYDTIAQEARRRYPTDYSMQDFIIRDEIAAYRKLHP